jgi:NADH:ubiquinone oxidoreductase subunit 3 (subunit A)
MVSDMLLAPVITFLLYLALAGLLAGVGRMLAGPAQPAPMKSSTYAGGEAPPAERAVPGYRSFFSIALFFAILHLGALVVGSGGLSPTTGIYLLGLALVLLALMLG